MNHLIGLLFVALCVIAIVAALAWNFWPGLRERMKGYTTVLETLLGTGIAIYGELIGGIQDAQTAGYLPPQIATYVPIALFLWFLLKRLGTTTPPGKSL